MRVALRSQNGMLRATRFVRMPDRFWGRLFVNKNNHNIIIIKKVLK